MGSLASCGLPCGVLWWVCCCLFFCVGFLVSGLFASWGCILVILRVLAMLLVWFVGILLGLVVCWFDVDWLVCCCNIPYLGFAVGGFWWLAAFVGG